jgi:hypothetical protein
MGACGRRKYVSSPRRHRRPSRESAWSKTGRIARCLKGNLVKLPCHRCSHNDTSARAKQQVRGSVDLGYHYANTPTVAAQPILLAPPNTVFGRGDGDR